MQKVATRSRRPSQSDMERVVRGAERQIDKLTLRYSTGQIGGRDYIEAIQTLLEGRHARAATLGRNRAGDYDAQNDDDKLFARLVMEGYPGDEGQNHFLQGFLNDLFSGRYTDEDGNPKVAQIRQRAQSYTGRIVGTANEMFVASSVLYSFDWKLGGVEDHCERCPELARNSPYVWDRLPTVPKGNKTPCLYHCKCYLKRSDGVTGFRGVE